MDALELIKEGRLKRYFMARKKILVPEGIYHVTQRAAGREPLFLEESDYLFMLHLLKEKSKKFNFELFSFALMPNHLHLQVKILEPNLSEAMKNVFETYANFFNKKYERKGHVFCGVFRCALCLDDAYLIAASLYIHLNPVKAGLAPQPSEYRWSSCSAYLAIPEKATFINCQYILKILNENVINAKNIYNDLLNKGAGINTEEVLENPRALEFFKINLLKILPFNLKPEDDPLNDKDLDNKIKELSSKQRLRSPQALKARKFLIEQLKARGYSILEIAKKLNLSRQSIYTTLNLTK